MNQARFNLLMEQFIRWKAGELAAEEFKKGALLAIDKLDDNRLTQKIIKIQINDLNEELESLDQRADQLNKQKPRDKKLETKISDEIEQILIKKALIQCEILYFESKIRELEHAFWLLLKDKEFLIYCHLKAGSNQAKKTLNDTMHEEMAVAHNALNDEVIAAVVRFPEDIDQKGFAENANHLFECHFEHHIAYSALVKTISACTKISHWSNYKLSKNSFALLAKINKTVNESKGNTPKQLFKKIQQLAAQAHKEKGFFDEKDEVMALNFFKAIVNEDLMTLEIFKLKFDALEQQKPPENLTTATPTPIQPKLTENSDKESRELSKLVSVYLTAQAAELVAMEAAQETQRLIDEFKVLELAIKQAESEISGYKNKMELAEHNLLELEERYKQNCEEHPTLRTEITKHHEQDKKKIEGTLLISEMLLNMSKKTLNEKAIQYNNLVVEHVAAIRQCTTLHQYAVSLKDYYLTQTTQAIKRVHPELEDSTLSWMANESFELGEKKDPLFLQTLKQFTKDPTQYSLSYEELNQKIKTLANHSYWQQLDEKAGSSLCISQIAKILTDSTGKGPKFCFESAQKKAEELVKKPSSFWTSKLKLHPDAKLLLEAISDKDMLKLEKLALKLDFAAPDGLVSKGNVPLKK